MSKCQVVRIETAADERLEPFRDLRHRNLTHFSQRFVAEGWNVVERLLKSDFETEFVLCAPKYLDRILEVWKDPHTVYVLDDEQFPELVGFQFHRGALAFAKRNRLPPLRSVIEGSAALPPSCLWCGVVGVQDPENFGTILRTCAGLGIDTVLIGNDCCDPFSRRVLRTSMGNSLKLQLISAEQLEADMSQLRQQAGFQVLASSLAEDSQSLQEVQWRARRLILFGNEGHGLPLAVQQASDIRLRIDMSLGTDSLNVSVAAGIILHFAARLAPV